MSGLFDAFAGLAREGAIDFPVEFTFDARLGPYAFWNPVAVVILAYGVLSGQVPGIDVTFRMGISRSTLAAVFIAVFFVASEAAQAFFGERFESGYLGILVAGALVFTIAPLSRLADRIAEKAVPPDGGDRASRPVASEREEAFQHAVRLALRDRQLSRTEERDLFRLASVLGVEAGRAHEILAESEDQVANAE